MCSGRCSGGKLIKAATTKYLTDIFNLPLIAVVQINNQVIKSKPSVSNSITFKDIWKDGGMGKQRRFAISSFLFLELHIYLEMPLPAIVKQKTICYTEQLIFHFVSTDAKYKVVQYWIQIR